MSEARIDTSYLCNLLATAAEKLAAVRGPIWSSYESGEAIAKFVLMCKARIDSGTIDLAEKRELWGLFAPTCDWDNIIDDAAFGQEIFDQVDQIFGHEIRDETRQSHQ